VWDVAVDAAGNVYAADPVGQRLQKLSPTGQPLAEWRPAGLAGFPPGPRVPEAGGPTGVALDTQGNVYVADRDLNRVRLLSPQLQPLAEWGSGRRTGYLGEFDSPSGVAVDATGNLYVADTGNHRIQKFAPLPP
jgi:sugar lactone lactonase YvrE